MEGEPLEYAKRACAYVVDLLEPNDILSVITFEDGADVIMPARRVVNKALVKDYINRIYAGNTTNLYEGLMTACQQVASVKSENTLNRVLLLTDGEPTAGTKDFASIVGQVAEQKGRGITVTALGFGPDYNEELMAGIARRSGGNYYYIARPELIPEVFRTRTGHADADHGPQPAPAPAPAARRHGPPGLRPAARLRQPHRRGDADRRGARHGPVVAVGAGDLARARPARTASPAPNCSTTTPSRAGPRS